jgi:catechol 2,3-dioxygenase-like lactoylglutathione lyase family enzyme
MPVRFGHFEVVQLDNDVALDFAASQAPIQSQHLAFLIGEDDFDPIFGRIRAQGLGYWADSMRTRPGESNRDDGGRGVYFADPDDHLLEVITRPYGSG